MTENALTTVGEIQFEKGCFDECVLIDSDGYYLRVQSAIQVKRIFSVFNFIKKYRSVRVELQFSDRKKLNLNDAKELVFQRIKDNHWYGKKIGISTEKDLKEWIFEVRDFRDLVCISDLFS